jgi:hypothetical protein
VRWQWEQNCSFRVEYRCHIGCQPNSRPLLLNGFHLCSPRAVQTIVAFGSHIREWGPYPGICLSKDKYPCWTVDEAQEQGIVIL